MNSWYTVLLIIRFQYDTTTTDWVIDCLIGILLLGKSLNLWKRILLKCCIHLSLSLLMYDVTTFWTFLEKPSFQVLSEKNKIKNKNKGLVFSVPLHIFTTLVNLFIPPQEKFSIKDKKLPWPLPAHRLSEKAVWTLQRENFFFWRYREFSLC